MSFGVSKAVAAVINKFAEKYLESVDGSQLQLDIFKQKGQIQNVFLKSSALDDLKLPIQIKTGHVGSLYIEFPLTNIWSGKWRIELVDISVVATPAKITAWSREEIEAADLSAKLKQIEMREAISIPTDGDSTFAERLSAKVLENLDLTFRNLHIRYEDSLTIRGESFSFGVAFEEIKLHSANIDDNTYKGLEGLCRKVGGIEKFSVYLETGLTPADLFSNKFSREEVLEGMRRWKCRKDAESQCIFGPVSCTTDVVLCISPWKNDWMQPKTVVDLIITNLIVGVSKSQFRTSYLLAQTFDVWSKGVPYRKFHPGVSEYKGNARKWWKFAINCVLDDVHRKNAVWSWKEHFERNMRYRRTYRSAYEKQLRGTKLSEAERKEMKEAERFLSVGNMLRERKLAQEALEREKKTKAEQSSGWSLTSWFFGKKGTTVESPTEPESAVSQIQMALRSEEEQQALRDALDLAGESQSQYPKHFRAFTAKFRVKRVDFILRDDELGSNVFHMEVDEMEFGLAKRPAADSVRLTASLTNFAITNGKGDGELQVLVERHAGTSDGLLLHADFETNPDEDNVSCDQKLTVKALPLDVYFSWSVLEQVKSIFKPPNTEEFSQLKAQAEQAVGAVQQSLAELEYTKKAKAMMILLDVDMLGSYVIVPESGTYIDGCSCIVANLGTLRVKSLENPAWEKGYHRKTDIKDVEEEATKLIQMSYDIYQLDIENVQVVSVMENETWLEQLEDEASCLLGKTNLTLNAKITALKDVRAPKVIVDGTLPALNLSLVDRRVSDALKILKTMSPPMTEKERKRARKVEKRKRKKRAKEKAKEDTMEEQRLLEGSFKLKSLTVNLSQFAGFGVRPFATLSVTDVALTMKMLEEEQRFRFSIREVLLLDATEVETYYRTILTQLGSERTLDLKVNMYSLRDEELNDENKYQMSVQLVGASLQFLFLNRFIQDLVAYSSRLSVDKAAIIDASQVAADQALANLKELYQNQTRIKLDVSLNAPVILLPKGSTESHVLVVDLGKLKICNKFEAGVDVNTYGDRALYDNMSVELQECKVSLGLCETDGSSRVRSECYLVEPVSFHIGVRRSLSRWNKVGPEITVNAKLTKICILLCEADIPNLQKILDSNFKESGQIEQFEERISVFDEVSSMTSDWSTASELTANSIDLERVKVKASVVLEGAKVELFTGCTALTRGVARRNLELSYVVLQILDLTADFEMRNDTSFCFNAELKGVTMRDSRVDETIKHRKLIEPRVSKEGHNVAMMVVNGAKSKTGDFDVSVVFAGVQILVCVPFYLRLIPFFTNPEAEESKRVMPNASAQPRELNFESRYAEPVVNTMQVVLTMNNIEMLLVESLSDEKAYAVVAKVRADMQYLKSGALTNLQLGIGKLEMFSCPIDLLKQPTSRAAILAPVKGHVHFENLGTQNLTEVECKLEPISSNVVRVNIAPGTVDLFHRAISTLLKGHEQEQDEEKPWEDQSRLFTPSPAILEELHAFIPLDAAKEIDEEYTGTSQNSPSNESLDFSAPTEVFKMQPFDIEVNVEAGLTLGPLVRVEIGIRDCRVVDWSDKLFAELSLSLQVLYYSDRSSWMIFAVEPLPCFVNHKMIERPFKFALQAKKNPSGSKVRSPTSGEIVQQPEWTYTIKSEDQIELTATKSLLDVLSTLGEAFGEKEKKQLTVVEHWWGLKVTNDLHVELAVDVQESGFFDGDNPEATTILMKPRSEKSMSIKSKSSGDLHVRVLHDLYKISTKNEAVRNLRVSDKDGFVVVEVKKSEGQTVVHFRSKLQIMNHTKRSVYVYTADKSDRVLHPCGTIRRCGVFSMPPDLLASGSVYFVPEGDYHHTHFSWKVRDSAPTPEPVTLECRAKKEKDSFYFKVITEHRTISSFGPGEEKLMATTLHLCPTLMLVNELPFDFIVRLVGSSKEFVAKPGQSVAIENLNAPSQMSVMIKYMDTEYLCQKATSALVGAGYSEASWDFEALGTAMLPHLILYSITKTQENTPHAFLHAKFWLMNSTGLPLICKNEAGDITEVPERQVVLFHSKGSRSGFRLGYKKGWSDAFRLDAPGSEITFKIKSHDATYMISGTISLASAGMTFKVVLMPGIQFVNNTRFPLMYEFLENTPLDSPMDDKFLGPKTTKGVWPRDPEKTKVILRPHGCLDATGALPLTPRAGVLIRMKGMIGAVFVEYISTNSMTSLCISEYSPGLAPWKIVNLSGESLVYGQKNSVMHILGPSQKALFTWDDPLSDCILMFGSEHETVEAALDKATYSELIVAPGSPPQLVYWQSFILDQQPTIVITEDVHLLAAIDQSDRFGKPQMCLRLQLDGVGLSLVDEERRKEIAYATVFRPTKWLYKSQKGAYKNFSDADSEKLEVLFLVNKNSAQVVLERFGRTEVCFGRMILVEGERPIRRAFDYGLAAEVTFFENGFRECSFTAAAVQLDNHLEGCLYPVVFSPAPPPKTVVATNVARPFLYLFYIDRVHAERSSSDIIAKAVLQDAVVNVELPFILGLVNFLYSQAEPERERESQRVAGIRRDLAFPEALQPSRSGQRTFVRLIDISPANVQLSFSLSNVQSEIPEFLAFVLRTVNVTSFTDASLSFDAFILRNGYQSTEQLIQALRSYYTTQGLTQVYKIALGLDILGNPLKFVSGIGTGVGSFMSEPFEGAMQGADEFAEGLVIGTKRLFQGTIGGAAGALGTIAGALATGATAMTFDRRHQIERREQKIAKAKGQTGLPAVAGNVTSFVDNVASGVAGVFIQPVQGAKEEGASGFFKGVGRGLMGLVARPVAAVADLAADTFKTVETAAGSRSQLKRRRLTRFIPPQGVEPYVKWKAEGAAILKSVGSLTEEVYVAHATDNRKNVVLVTNRRIMYLKKSIVQEHEVQWIKELDGLKVGAVGTSLSLSARIHSETLSFDTEHIAKWMHDKINAAKTS